MKHTQRFSRPRRDDQQVPTVSVTMQQIMRDPKFALGVNDARAGRGYPADYERWKHTNDQWSYERGRQWGRLAPRSLSLKVDCKVNPLALRYGDDII